MVVEIGGEQRQDVGSEDEDGEFADDGVAPLAACVLLLLRRWTEAGVEDEPGNEGKSGG